MACLDFALERDEDTEEDSDLTDEDFVEQDEKKQSEFQSSTTTKKTTSKQSPILSETEKEKGHSKYKQEQEYWMDSQE